MIALVNLFTINFSLAHLFMSRPVFFVCVCIAPVAVPQL